MTTCQECSKGFETPDVAKKIFAKINAPLPTLCPDCRQRQRCAWRNERSLYKRTCDLTGRETVSFYPANSPYKVYSKDAWWSDDWDPLEYGRECDFNRPFFDQFGELLMAVPHMALIVSHGENNDYCPYSVYYKDSYMCVSGVVGENIYYSYWTNDSRDCMDCNACFRCERCYECMHCDTLYSSIFCRDCRNGNDLSFCANCDGCKNCIGCYGLRNQEYQIFNKPVSKEAFKKFSEELRSGAPRLEAMKEEFANYLLKFPQQALQNINCENCTGDYLRSCRNALECYMAENLEDCAYAWNIPQGAKDACDINYTPKGELIYNAMSGTNSSRSMALVHGWDLSESFYCFECFYGNDLFGCVGLKHKKYCILNKQYSKEDYFNLKSLIINHMGKTGEWGQFFPIALSPFAYNETIAQEYFPLTKEQAVQKGWRWKDPEIAHLDVKKIIPAAKLPDNVSGIPDDILNWAIQCEVTHRPFRIVAQELKFYRDMGLPIPHLHPDERYRRRKALENSRRLYARTCAKCQAPIETTYQPERLEIVYCEACYLKEVY
ncbi:hypothetical protein HZA43_00945 [Candidatus Peregrinibacteria bacterium]|nr:hypothetical protein [Candidatus Peregrinibacteria bacterium]